MLSNRKQKTDLMCIDCTVIVEAEAFTDWDGGVWWVDGRCKDPFMYLYFKQRSCTNWNLFETVVLVSSDVSRFLRVE